MKKRMIAVAISLAISLIFALSLGAQVRNGPIVDKVIFDVRMDQAIGIKDVIEGKTDVFYYGLDGKYFSTLSAADKAKLDIYSIPSGSWSLLLNPIPNKAPYSFTAKDGKTYFNPLAIRDVRYAINWLIDRKKIVDEILLGGGDPSMTAMTAGQPGSYRYNLIPAKLGMSARGNEKKAIDDITAAMNAAAGLPENKGKLVKSGQFWTYNGAPVTVRFIIRVDDPSGRLLSGRYIADQIEKAGIKVERLEYDRSKAAKLAYNSDPAEWGWSMYTEGWGAGATRAWWDVSLCQMYSPWYGYMPGGATAGFWNYENKELDDITRKTYNGWFMDAEEYWRDNLKATEMALKESVRIYVATQMQYYLANKARFNGKMLYGVGDGLNGWSIRSADVKPVNGQKVLRATQFSSKGSLFMSSWNPVGTDGFSDVYSSYITEETWDPPTFESPNAAKDTELTIKWNLAAAQTKMVVGKDGKLEGQISVPANAVIYNSNTKKWESGIEYKQDGDKYVYAKNPNLKSYSKNEITYKYGKWHSGASVSLADLMYATAFQYEWATKDSDNDKYYDAAFASLVQPGLVTSRGQVVGKNGVFSFFFNYNWPMDKERAITGNGSGLPSPKAGNGGRPNGVSWEIYEALALLVAEGSKSGTVYSFSSDPATTEVDVIQPKCVADIKAKLEDMLAKKYVPVSIKDYCSADEAVARYRAALAFINKNGHAYISNGPFYISKIDFNANYIELSAVRDYPYKSDYWPKALKSVLTRIDNVRAPATAQRNKDAEILITVSDVSYPDDVAVPASSKTIVKVALQLPEGGEKIFNAKFDRAGSFKCMIPAKDLGALKPGAYTAVIMSNIAAEAPAVTTLTLVLF